MKLTGFWAPRHHGLIGLLLAAAALAGCAHGGTTVAEDRQDDSDSRVERLNARSELLWERSIGAKTASTPSFYADTPGRRTFGILGVMAMAVEGNRLVRAYGIEDPATTLSEELLASLALQNRMRTSSRRDADVLLEVKTINWDFRPYRNDPDDLFVVYSARVNLVDRRDGQVLASGKCRAGRERSGDSATLEQLLADNAARLRQELREAAHECAQSIKGDTLAAFLNNTNAVAQNIDLPRRQ
jgi:hypothetical protein